jgi:hypothetical protein
MDTQEEKAVKSELIAEAKALGIVAKGLHLYSVKKLQDTIASVKENGLPVSAPPAPTKEPERKKAPKMSLAGLQASSRSEVIKNLEADNPGYKYLYQSSAITAEQLAQKGLESTGQYHKSDLICRTDKESYDEYLAQRNIIQRQLMDSIDTEGTKIKSFDANPKAPKGAEK